MKYILKEGVRSILQGIKDRCFVIMISLFAISIGLGANVMYLQYEYLELSKEMLILIEERASYQEPIVVVDPFIPNEDSNVSELHTSKEQIIRYLSNKSLEINADLFFALSEQYQIDAGFALAIWSLETGHGQKGTAWAISNNPAGIRCGIEYCTYSNKDEGLDEMFQLLKAYIDGSISYVGKKSTPAEIRAAWSETDDVVQIVDIWRTIYEGS